MKPQRRPPEFFDRLSEQPIELKTFDPAGKQRASTYCAQLNQLLAPFHATAELFGSTDLEIATKGEWEFAIYLNDEQWYPALVCLINHYGSIYTLIEDFAVFEDTSEGTPIEIIPMRAEAAERNRALMDYWRKDRAAAKAYEQGKLLHAYSKREYYRWKDEYIASIVEKF
jgi:GrpB-like predicted nucleotidyltransferase (UPF0157 family)